MARDGNGSDLGRVTQNPYLPRQKKIRPILAPYPFRVGLDRVKKISGRGRVGVGYFYVGLTELDIFIWVGSDRVFLSRSGSERVGF